MIMVPVASWMKQTPLAVFAQSVEGTPVLPCLEMALLPDPWQAQWHNMTMDAGHRLVRRVDLHQGV